jgi:hypothetical protein
MVENPVDRGATRVTHPLALALQTEAESTVGFFWDDMLVFPKLNLASHTSVERHPAWTGQEWETRLVRSRLVRIGLGRGHFAERVWIRPAAPWMDPAAQNHH